MHELSIVSSVVDTVTESVAAYPMHCDKCAADVELDGVQSFRCPRCGEPCTDLRQGRELDIESFEIDEVEEKVKA